MEVKPDQLNVEEIEMRRLVSRIPDLLEQKGWDSNTFVAYCLLKGLGQNTAYRLARGEVNVSMATLAAVCDVLEVDSISELIDVVQEEPI